MLSSQQVTLAENLGLPLWFERRSRFSVRPPLLFARLGIVLSQELNNEAELKVFEGMLSVLSLQEDSYWVGGFHPHQPDITAEQLSMALQKWQPQVVLLMGQPFRKWAYFTATYHPQELIEDISLKKKAYQDLLQLKEILNLIKPE